MSTDAGRDGAVGEDEDQPAAVPAADGAAAADGGPKKGEVDINRRALVQAGWAVPAVIAVGLPRNAKAAFTYGPGKKKGKARRPLKGPKK